MTYEEMVELVKRFTPRVRAVRFAPDELRKNPLVYTPDPKSTPTVVVAETALPSASTTARCDVLLPAYSRHAAGSSGIDASPVAGRVTAGVE